MPDRNWHVLQFARLGNSVRPAAEFFFDSRMQTLLNTAAVNRVCLCITSTTQLDGDTYSKGMQNLVPNQIVRIRQLGCCLCNINAPVMVKKPRLDMRWKSGRPGAGGSSSVLSSCARPTDPTLRIRGATSPSCTFHNLTLPSGYGEEISLMARLHASHLGSQMICPPLHVRWEICISIRRLVPPDYSEGVVAYVSPCHYDSSPIGWSAHSS